jgi:citrate lyase subunit beta / citryl-CoA lyase
MRNSGDQVGASLAAIRSALFVPADAVGRHERAFAAGADAVLLDLEDAVAPGAKDAARQALVDSPRREGGPLAVVRINSPATELGEADLEAVAAMPVDAILVPKADPPSVAAAATAGFPLLALIESAAGVLAAAETAAHPAVAALMLGPVDLGVELGLQETPDGDELAVARGTLVLAAAAAGLPGPLDGPCLRPRDEHAQALEIERARRLGFGGKVCIHPDQVPAVVAAFAPGEDEVAWARRTLAAFEEARGGVVVLDGEMIDRPVARRAERILAAAGEG